MGVTQVAAMPQDLLAAIPAQSRAGEMGASEGASFRKVLQERQSSSEASPSQNRDHAASSSPRHVTGRSPAFHKPAVEERDDEAMEDGKSTRDSKAEGPLPEESPPQLDGREEAADEAAVENVKEVSEPPVSVAGNAVVVIADAAPNVTVANVVTEKIPDHEGAAATVAVGSAADIETGMPLDSGVGAAGTAVIAEDGGAAVAVTGGATAAEKAGETAGKVAGAVAEKPAQHVRTTAGGSPKEENKGAATEDRRTTGTIASEKTPSEDPRLQRVPGGGTSGTDEASARLDAAAGLAAVEQNAADATAKQNQGDGAQVASTIPSGQDDAGRQVQEQKGMKDVATETPTTQGASPADVRKTPAAVPEKESALRAEPKEARLEGEHGRDKVAEALEQGAAVPVRDLEAASPGKTSPVADAQADIPQAKAAEESSGNRAGKGGDEQQQAKQGEQVLPPPLGAELRSPDAAGSYKNEEERTALHRSILSQVKDGAVTHDSRGNGQMNIRLNPAELGELNIQVRMEDGRVRVDVQADNRMVKDLLMSNLDTLKEALAGKNFTMEGFEVSTGGGFNNAHPEQRANPQQHFVRRVAGSGYAEADGSEGRVKYLTADVNNLLDVRF